MTGREVLDVLSAILLLSGVAFAVVAGLGMLRLPDVFSRMHAATKPSTLGLALILSGAALRVENGGDAATLLLIGAFQFLTVPVGAHMIGRSSYRAGTGALDELVVDELRDGEGGAGGPVRRREVTPPVGRAPRGRWAGTRRSR